MDANTEQLTAPNELSTQPETIKHTRSIKALIVIQKPELGASLARVLEPIDEFDVEITQVSCFVEAAKAVSTSLYDGIFCDMSLPNMSPVEILKEMKTHAPSVNLIALLEYDNLEVIENLFANGAQDYLIHSQWDQQLLQRLLRYLVARQKINAELERLTHYDSLTGIANRFLFNDRLAQAVIRAERSNQRVAVLFLDLDHFHGVNEALGYDTGDLMLIETANRLTSCVRKQDTTARLGSDEFAVVLEGISEPQHVMSITREILRTFTKPLTVHGEPIFISLSIGISISTSELLDAHILIKQADIARYRAKESGRNTFEFFDPGYHEMASQRLEAEHSVHHTLNRLFKQNNSE